MTRIVVEFTDKEYKDIESEAARARLPLPDYIRWLTLRRDSTRRPERQGEPEAPYVEKG